jgi:hypothetical protein
MGYPYIKGVSSGRQDSSMLQSHEGPTIRNACIIRISETSGGTYHRYKDRRIHWLFLQALNLQRRGIYILAKIPAI